MSRQDDGTASTFTSDHLRDLLVELCVVPSPSRDERAIADLLTSRFTALGMSVREDDAATSTGGRAGTGGTGGTAGTTGTGGNAGNLIAELPGERPGRIVLAAHMDTVPLVPGEPLVAQVDGSVVRSSGRQILGADDKAGVAIVIAILERLAGLPPAERPTVIAVITVCEELGLLGAHQLDVAALRADFAYSFDGEVPVGELIAKAVFKEDLTLLVRGRRAHAALEPEAGIHAIAAAAEVVRSFPLGRSAQDLVANIGSISGGGATNVVPDRVELRAEARSFSLARLEELIAGIETGAAAAIAGTGAALHVERRRLYDGYDLSEDSEPFWRLKATASAHALTPSKVVSIGGSDTNVLNQKGLQTVNVGIDMHEIHSVDEWIDAAELAKVAGWVLDALLLEG